MRKLIYHGRYFGLWPLADAASSEFAVYLDPKYRSYIIRSLVVRLRGEHENPPDLVISFEHEKTQAIISNQDDVATWGVNFDADLSKSFEGLKIGNKMRVIVDDIWAEDIGLMSEVAIDIIATHWLGFGTNVVCENYGSSTSYKRPQIKKRRP